jgi:hypothetical protein
MLEKLGLATAITFSLYLLVKVPTPTGTKFGGQSIFAHQISSATPRSIAARSHP